MVKAVRKRLVLRKNNRAVKRKSYVSGVKPKNMTKRYNRYRYSRKSRVVRPRTRNNKPGNIKYRKNRRITRKPANKKYSKLFRKTRKSVVLRSSSAKNSTFVLKTNLPLNKGEISAVLNGGKVTRADILATDTNVYKLGLKLPASFVNMKEAFYQKVFKSNDYIAPMNVTDLEARIVSTRIFNDVSIAESAAHVDFADNMSLTVESFNILAGVLNLPNLDNFLENVGDGTFLVTCRANGTMDFMLASKRIGTAEAANYSPLLRAELKAKEWGYPNDPYRLIIFEDSANAKFYHYRRSPHLPAITTGQQMMQVLAEFTASVPSLAKFTNYNTADMMKLMSSIKTGTICKAIDNILWALPVDSQMAFKEMLLACDLLQQQRQETAKNRLPEIVKREQEEAAGSWFKGAAGTVSDFVPGSMFGNYITAFSNRNHGGIELKYFVPLQKLIRAKHLVVRSPVASSELSLKSIGTIIVALKHMTFDVAQTFSINMLPLITFYKATKAVPFRFSDLADDFLSFMKTHAFNYVSDRAATAFGDMLVTAIGSAIFE